ncbi:MAG TPA: porin family protein [Saprospiraceae bacterium]|nr:porin family protein [Saprospiraceae bacterium]
MKKMFVFSLLALQGFNPSQAQTQWSIEAGPSHSNIRIEGDANLLPNPKSITGFHAGLAVTHPLGSRLDLKSGIRYHQTGFSASLGAPIELYGLSLPAEIKAVTRMHYLEMPLLAQIRLVGSPSASWYLEAGPQLGYALDGDIHTKARLLFDFDLGSYDLNLANELFSRFEIAGLIGTGMQWRTASGMQFHFGVQYLHGFTDLTDEPIIDIQTSRNAWTAQGGIRIAL